MKTAAITRALLLGAILASSLAACKDRTVDENQPAAPVGAPTTVPDTATPTPAEPMPPTTTTPPADTPPPPADTPPGTSGSSGTTGTTGNPQQPPSTAPDRVDQPATRDRRPTY